MEIQPTGGGGFYIYLKREELRTPAERDITMADAFALVRRAVGGDFSDSEPRYCLELYEGRDSLLLFAAPNPGKPAFFAFAGLEDLIGAAKSCGPGIVSFLFAYRDTYYLSVYQQEPEPPPAQLFEFGEELALSPFFPLFLAEHGAALAGPYAIDTIKEAF